MFQATSNFRALVADPSLHMTGLVATMLRSLKIRLVDEIQNALQAEAALAARPYQLVLIDVEVCSDRAFARMRQLRQSEGHPNRHVPIIMMAAAPSAALIAAARDAGVTEFLRKPFSANDIARRLGTLDSAPRAFVSAAGYAGPDRRRRALPGAPNRRAADSPA